MPTYQPLTPDQFTKAKSAGFSTPQIIEMEKKRKQQSTAPLLMAERSPEEPAAPDTYNAPFPAAPTDNPLVAGAKALGNTPRSAFGLAKTLVDAAVHPVRTVKAVGSAAVGGVERALGAATGRTIDDDQTQSFDALAAALKERYGSLENAQRTATNDPFAFGADIVGLLAGGGTLVGKTAQLGNAATKAASVITKPVAAAAAKGSQIAGQTAKFSASQAMGLSDDTLSLILTKPDDFTKEAQAAVNRRSIAEEVQASLAARQDALSETGAHYGPVRDAATPVAVEPTFIENALKKHAGVEVIEGKIMPGTTSKLRSPTDIRAAQQLYEFWAPSFQTGTMTSPEFLNFRSDLAELAKFDRELSKSKPLENVAKGIRHDLNENYRGQIPELETLDADFAAQQSDFSRLSKGIINKEGDLTDAAINRIANATGKGKDILIDRLEEANPGITQRIRTLKAVEDIQSLKGQIPGKYGRAGLFLGAAYTLNPWLAAGTILALPELGVPILRGLGMATPKIQKTLELLGVPFKAVNDAPAAAAAAAAALPIAQAPK